MALKDDKTLTKVTNQEYVLLLEGRGIITNMSELSKKLKYRIDTEVPDKTSAARILNGSDLDKNSFVNENEDVKIYGIAKSDYVELLITRDL